MKTESRQPLDGCKNILHSKKGFFRTYDPNNQHILACPYWEVRMKAAQALRKLRHNIPEKAIRPLRELRSDIELPTVSRTADDALAEILSLETSIEDE